MSVEAPKAAGEVKGTFRTFQIAGYLIIFFGVVVTGTFAAYANIASAVFASGVVAVESSRKVVQHLEGGIVQKIEIKEAQPVEQGQVLIRLDPTRAKSTADLYRSQLFAMLGEQGRLEAEQVGREFIGFPEYLAASVNNPLAKRIMEDQERLFRQGRDSLHNQIEILNKRIAQLRERVTGWEQQQAALQSQIASLTEQKDGLSGLTDDGLYAANDLRSLERQLAGLTGEYGEATAQLASARGAIEESLLQIEQLQHDYRRSAADKLTALRAEITDLRERLTVADDAVARLEIRAPQTGIVQNLQIHTPGGVIAPGEPLLEIVPTGDDLIINAQVPTTAVDSVHPDMVAEVRFPAFHSRNLPILLGRVTSVSADAITDEQSGASFYLAKVRVEPDSIPLDFREKLQAGMPAEVVMTTGERTILDYLTRPLTDAVGRGMREE